MDFLDQQKGIALLIFVVAYSIVLYIYANRQPRMFTDQTSMERLATITSRSVENRERVATGTSPLVDKRERVLVLYVWVELQEQSLGNLEFFVRHAVHQSQPADYYFILQKINKKEVDEKRLPLLPPNAHYIQHENECYDIGTFGWFLSQNIINTTLYKYFIFMNSSVRGPFFVPYFEQLGIWWFHIFTSRLTDQIKLVGPTINCDEKPHVQSYLMVTDQVGFTILTKQTGIFRCHANYNDAIDNGEVAASQLILHANYQIASLQSKYQGWDFRKQENQGCNHANSPIFHDRAIDTISHDPFELVFVKFKGEPPFDTDLERRALIYQKWIDERPRSQENN